MKFLGSVTSYLDSPNESDLPRSELVLFILNRLHTFGFGICFCPNSLIDIDMRCLLYIASKVRCLSLCAYAARLVFFTKVLEGINCSCQRTGAFVDILPTLCF